MSLFHSQIPFGHRPLWKKISPKIALLMFVALAFFVWLWSNEGSRRDVDFFAMVPPSSVEFAGEKALLDDAHYFHRERLEKEVSVLRWNIYQPILNYKRSGLYFPLIEKKLAEANIPDDFKYLAMAESSLRNDVTSSASAGGIWQLLPATARELGLRVDSFVDERYHPAKATDAAIKYLEKAYARFGNWTLVAASYNRGISGISNALAEQGVESFYDLSLNAETSQYIFRILAAKYCYIHRNAFVGKNILGEPFVAPKTKSLHVSGKIDLKKWAKEHNMTYISLQSLNPWFLTDTLPEGDWQIEVLDL